MITNRDKLNCVIRELRQRRRVYPRLVEKGRMTPELAAREIAHMEVIVADYEALEAKERLL